MEIKKIKGFLRKRINPYLPLVKNPVPRTLPVFEFNRELHDRYAKNWSKNIAPDFIDNKDISEDEIESYIEYLGDEWGTKKDVEEVVEEFIYPFIDKDSVVAEIGIGGGRIASKVAGKVKKLHGFDISQEMLKKAKEALSNFQNIDYILIEGPEIPETFKEKFDFVYSFDTLIQFDLHLLWKYFNEVEKILKPSGKAFFHTKNLKTQGGWEHFIARERRPFFDGHYYFSPETINVLAEKSNLRIIKTSEAEADNSKNQYFRDDYLFVLEYDVKAPSTD